LTIDNADQQRRLAGLSQPIDNKLAELKQTIELRRTQGFDAALKVVETNVGKAYMDEARVDELGAAPIASELAAGIYGLASLAANIEDAAHNTTRFLVMAKEPREPRAGSGPSITTFVFRVRNVPAALYKAMGGFATNAVNMTKLESYQIDGTFTATLFYADVEGHPAEVGLRHALEELEFFSAELRILGVYPAHPFRFEARKAAEAG